MALGPVAPTSSSLRPAVRQPCSCRCTTLSLHASHRNPPVQSMALRPAIMLLRRSAFTGGKLALQSGHRAGMSQRGSSRGSLQVTASFFGVGAPEAVLVGLVALVIFGPQGLAEAAKTAGRTIRAFKPTIDELSNVSRDLRTTLDEELGINEIRNEFRGYTSPTRSSQQPDWDDLGTMRGSSSAGSSSSAPSSEKDPDLEAKRAQSVQMAWGNAAPAQQQQASAARSPSALDDVTLEELQAELARRRVAKKDSQST